jgi:energy-coupling factor transporter transmembrane protein EcfT
MNQLLLLAIIFIIAIIIIGVIVRFVKAFARTVIILVILGLIVGGSIYVLRDANDLRVNFLPEEKLLVLDLEGNIVAAVISKGVSVPVPVTDVKGLNVFYHAMDYKAMLGDNYKLLVFKWDAFRDLKVVGDDKYMFTIEDVRKVMTMEDPKKYYIEQYLGAGTVAALAEIVSAQVDRVFPTNDYFRSVVFSFMIAKSFEDSSVFEAYAGDDVWIYPETVTLKLIRWLPFEWVRDFVSGSSGQNER